MYSFPRNWKWLCCEMMLSLHLNDVAFPVQWRCLSTEKPMPFH